jgi:uncharacterized membrane protein
VSCGLRDVAEFESAGRPAVLVASAAFERTAGEQARRLGAPGLRRVFVPHPVQDRTDDELREMAPGVVEKFENEVIG